MIYEVCYIGPDACHTPVAAELEGVARVRLIAPEPIAVAKALAHADGVLDASMKVYLSDEMIRNAPRLCIISCATTGSDHIARGEVERRGIAVRTLREDPGVLQDLTPAAELSWALLLACARRLPAATQHVRKGHWVREDFPGVMLRGRTIGLIGCGRIGGWMARYATAFGMTVIGYDPFVAPWPTGIERVTLETLVRNSDFVSIHVHLSDATRGLLSGELIAQLKTGAIVINTSRGALTDENALAAAIERGQLGGVGLDVLDGEPDVANHPLVRLARSHDNVLITPHCGGNSPDAVRLTCVHAARKIRDHLLGAR